MRRWRLFWLAAATCGSLALAGELEIKVQAAYLFNFTKFVEWPNDGGDVLNVCVVGKDAIADVLSELAARHSGRNVRIERAPLNDPKACHVLYLARDNQAAALLESVRGRAVLTVSEADNFAQQGGIIGFYMDDGKLKLEINAANAQAANLKISAKLMEVARVLP